MDTIWKLVTTCLIPIITYGGETRKPTKMEKEKKPNYMLDNIKRILMTPTSTPREALYIETGLLDIETIDDKNKITMGERLEKNSNNLLNEITNSHTPRGWKEYLEETKTKYEITGTTNREGTDKTNPKGKILKTFKTRIEKEGESKSKVKYLLEGNQGWTPGQPKRYMLQLGRTQASTIFKACTKMLQVKNNYKNAHKNLTCRACQKENETQEHVLTACPPDLKLTYHKLTTIMKELELCSSWNKSVERPGTSGYTHVVVVVD